MEEKQVIVSETVLNPSGMRTDNRERIFRPGFSPREDSTQLAGTRSQKPTLVNHGSGLDGQELVGALA